MKNNLLLLSGGVGTRFGTDMPKQYYKNSKGKMIIIKSLEPFSNKGFDKTIIVADKKYHNIILREIEIYQLKLGEIFFVENGKNRHKSIVNGLNKLEALKTSKNDLIFLQEAVRPYVKKIIVEELLSYDKNAENVAPGIFPIVLYSHYNGDIANDLIPKEKLVELQLPKRYVFGSFNQVLDKNNDGDDVLDESQFFLEAGIPINIIKGSRANIKITFAEDKVILEE